MGTDKEPVLAELESRHKPVEVSLAKRNKFAIYLANRMPFRTFACMKGADMLHVLTVMLKESQAQEKAATERVNSLEMRLADLLKLLNSLQELQKKNTGVIEELMRELKLLRTKTHLPPENL